MLKTRADLERYGQFGVFHSDYVLPNLSYMPSETMRGLRHILTDISKKWADKRLVPSHFPFLTDSNLILSLLPYFNTRVKPTEVRDSRSQRRQGYLPMFGGCLQAIPFLRKYIQSYRQIPSGVYSTDFAVSPYVFSNNVTGWEDIICINGIDIRTLDDKPRMKELIADLFSSYGLAFECYEDTWWFNEPANIFRLQDGHIIAVTQDYLSTLVDVGINYLDKENKSQSARSELFYVSQDALILLTNPEILLN